MRQTNFGHRDRSVRDNEISVIMELWDRSVGFITLTTASSLNLGCTALFRQPNSSTSRRGRHIRASTAVSCTGSSHAGKTLPGAPNDEDFSTDEPMIVDLSSPVQKKKKTRVRTSDLIREIQRFKDVTDSVDASGLPPIHLDDTAEQARTVVRGADKRKAIDPVVFRVSHLTCITSFMVCLTGRNSPQIRAIANIVEEDLFKIHNIKPKSPAQAANSGWLLLDYGDMMVHIFSPEQREFYDIETLWSRGEPLDISDCLRPVSAGDSSDSASNEMSDNVTGVDDGDDDDWLS